MRRRGRYAIDVVLGGVPGEFLRLASALLLVDLVENLPEVDLRSVIRLDQSLGHIVEVVCSFGLRAEVLSACAGLVEEQPGEGIEYRGLPGGIVAVDAGALASEVELRRAYALEVLQLDVE